MSQSGRTPKSFLVLVDDINAELVTGDVTRMLGAQLRQFFYLSNFRQIVGCLRTTPDL